MTTTQTSRLAYKEINEEGTSKNQKDRILEMIDRDNTGKGMSLREISAFTGIEINAVSGRVNDLKNERRLKTIKKRKCSLSKRLVSPVMLTTQQDIIDLNNEDKLKLLLRMYGYKQVSIDVNLNNEKSVKIGYYKYIKPEDLDKIHINCDVTLKEVSVWDDDCGTKYWYNIN